MYISHQLQKMAVITDEDRLVPSPEKLTIESMASVKSLGVDTVQMSHASGYISIGCLK